MCSYIVAQTYSSIWQLGIKDGKSSEFSLNGKSYKDFPKFFPDGSIVYSVGESDVRDVPSVFPGPSDSWAGNPNSTLLLNFGVDYIPKEASIRLIIDFVEVQSLLNPQLEISLNDFKTNVVAPKGQNIFFLDNNKTSAENLQVSVELPAESFIKNGNILKIKSISGSWFVLDDIRLESTLPVKIIKSPSKISLIDAYSLPALIYGSNNKEYLHPVRLNVINWGKKNLNVSWFCNEEKGGKIILKPGANNIELGISDKYSDEEVTISLVTDKKKILAKSLNIVPVDEWTIYLVQHTHTDIGYTKPQTEILSEHLRYIDYAIEYCEATENYPDDSKFRWTCEASWAVKEWLRIRPEEQIRKFLHYVKNGQIEVTAMFFNMSEISGENNYKTFLEPVKEFHKLGIDVKTAMQNDVNGLAWCLADYLPDIGVKYVTMGSNGHRANIPFDKPTLYKWESPSGKSVISYRADHYNTGNFWGIDKGYMKSLERGVFSYISSLKSRGYKFPLISAQYSGYFTDNSPASKHECELIRDWNEHYVWPKLRSATMREFMEQIEEKYSEDLPVYRAAYPDWWTDGFGSAARETAASRKTQSDLITIEGMLSIAENMGMNNVKDINKEISRIHENLLFYDEHTFGAAESISDPMCENSQIQWAEKGSYVWEALKSTQMLYETAIGCIQGNLYRSTKPTVTFFNTLGWDRSSLLKVYVDYEIIPKDRAFRIVDEKGNALKVQPLNYRNEGRYYAIWADSIPAMGYKTFEIILDEGNTDELPPLQLTDGIIENSFYKLKFDMDNGGIESVFDKELNKEIVDRNSEWNIGSYIYESLKNDRGQMEQKRFDNYDRTGLNNVVYTGASKGPIYNSVYFSGKGDGCNGVAVEVRIYNDVKRIELCYSIRRIPETEPSGIYVAFPFALDKGKIAFDVPGGLVNSSENQIPGSSVAWNTVQNFVSVRDNNSQVLVSTDAIPLFALGELFNNPYRNPRTYEKTHVFSWVMNNYWTTNFRASQEGELRWNYVMTSLSGNSNIDANTFGWENRIPMYARVIPASTKVNSFEREKSYLKIKSRNIMMTSCIPSKVKKNALFVNLRDVEGKDSELSIWGPDGSKLEFVEVNVLDEPIGDIVTSKVLKPYENVFVRVMIK